MVRPVTLQESDFTDLAAFQLAGRWAQEPHPSFSHDELKLIQPLAPKTAERLYQRLKQAVLSRVEMPGQNFFSCGASSLDVAPLDRKAVTDWIEERLPRGEEKIILSWISFGPDVAALVERSLFINHWENFCYPSSDDIDIWAPSLSCVLRYSRDEVFSFKKI